MQGIKPTGKRVLLKRLDGDGREEIRPSGIIMPARDESLRHGNAARVPDTFRALVLAVGEGAEKATQGELAVGDTVICHTYEQTSTRTLVGDETPYGLLVDVDNILAVERTFDEAVDTVADALGRFVDHAHSDMNAFVDHAHSDMNANAMSNRREQDQAILSLGYHRKGGF